MFEKIKHTILLFLVLLAVWFVLSGISSPLFLIFGAVSSAFAAFIALRMDLADDEGHPYHLAFTAPVYWLWLLKEMAKSGWCVTRIVWSREMDISPEFATVSLSQKSDLARTIYANSITLTPGTVCVDVDAKNVLVHALQSSSIQELKEGKMDRRVTLLTTARSGSSKKRR